MANVIQFIRRLVRGPGGQGAQSGLGTAETETYWTGHNVTLHHQFADAAESLAYFDWRNDQYFNYLPLMPVAGMDGKDVLDFGCGPGHDLVGFGVYSKPRRLVGADLSESSLGQAKLRLELHGVKAELVKLAQDEPVLPFADASFDHVHSSGVLHHTPDPKALLREFHRMLRPGGTCRIMIYNYNSLWVHLYVAYQRAIVQGLYRGEPLRDQFRHSTDGEDCPISNCYRPQEWIDLCEQSGFRAQYLGSGISMHEMGLLPLRYAAVQDRNLPAESRKFLLALKFDAMGYPSFEGHYAGIDACFLLTKAL